MNRTKFAFVTLISVLLLTTSAAITNATALRAFVSSTGNDANAATNCAQTAPCRTFAGAFPAVTAGGELIALDTSGYGPIGNINKSITIAAIPGARAFVVAAAGTNAFTINGATTDLIVLRGISFNGSGAASTVGVSHNGGKLTIVDCDFSQLTTGVVVQATPARVNIMASSFQLNGTGVQVGGGRVDIANCLISHNTIGVRADGDGGAQNPVPNGTTLVRIDGGSVTFNTTAFHSGSPGLKPGGGANGFNLFVRSINGVYTTNIIDNTTLLVITGNASQCGADPCVSPVLGTYTGQGI